MGITRSVTTNFNSFLQLLRSKTVTVDTILKGTGLRLVELDSFLQLSKTAGVDVDGLLTFTGTKYAVVNLDSILRQLEHQIYTMTARSVRTFVSSGY